MEVQKTLKVKVGNNLVIGDPAHIVVQTMCNTHTSDVDATVEQCRRMVDAGAELIRITVPGMADVPHIAAIHDRLKAESLQVPLVADIHFSSQTAIAVASVVEKVRINPGNFHPDHAQAKEQFAQLVKVCKEHGTAIRIGLNHGSLGKYITELYGNTPLAMAKAAMEWLELCDANDFHNVVVSLKSSNTVVMVEAYRILSRLMQEAGTVYPLHLGVTEAGNGDSGRIKSCVGISALLSQGIGNTVRVSLTEDPVNEIPVAAFLAARYTGKSKSSLVSCRIEGRTAHAEYDAPDRETLMLDASCDFGRLLLDREIDDVLFSGTYKDDGGINVDIAQSGFGIYLQDEILQAARRRFYKPEYIACPGCGRTMYNLQEAFETVKDRTSHLKGMVIAVMGCIVNGPGEMADADWGYVGEGNGKVSIYKKNVPMLRHIPESEAIDRLLDLIDAEARQ